VLALITALVAPYFINWSDYRDQFEREATRILGQPVTVAGDASARLIPFPSVTFEDVRVGDSEEPLVVADRFSLDAELSPFLRGEILIFDMRVENPRIRLRLDETGLPDWPLMTDGPVDPGQVVLESARIINGSIEITDETANRVWTLNELDATVSAQSLQGPLRLEGGTRINGNPVDFRVSTGTLSKDGFPLRTVLDMPRQGIEVTLDGRIAEPDETRREPYDGVFTVVNRSDRSGLRYLVEGAFEASPRAVSVPQYRAEFGSADDPYVVTGAGAVTGGQSPEYALQVRGTQITLPEEQDPATGVGLSAPTAAARLAAVQSALAAIPFPPMPGSIDVDLPAIIAGDTAIRDIRLKASPLKTGEAIGRSWTLTRFSAQLPGRTAIEASGTVQLPSSAGRNDGAFEGNMLVASRQPSGLAIWLTGDADEAIRRLENAGFSAKVALKAERQTIDELEVIAGPARLYGSLVRVSDPTRRHTLDVSLTGDGIELETLEALSTVFVGEGGAQRFSDHDLDIALDLTKPDINGLTLETLDATFRSRRDRIEIDRFQATGLYGAALSATASLGLNGNLRLATVDATVFAPDGAELLTGLKGRYPGVPGLDRLGTIAAGNGRAFSDTRLDIVGTVSLASELAGEASLSVSGESGNTQISVTTTANGSAEDPEKAYLFVNGAFENHAAEKLLAQAGFSGFAEALGPITAELTANGSLFDGMKTSLSLEGDDMYASLDGVWTADILSAGFTGTGGVEARDIEPWIMAIGYGMPGLGLGTTADLSAAISYRRGKAVLRGIEAILNGNGVKGDLTVAAAEGIPVIRGDLAFDYLDAGRFYGIVTGNPSGGAELMISDPDATKREYDDALMADHDIELGITASEMTLPTGSEPVTEFKTRLTYGGGLLSFSDFSGVYAGGRVSGDAEFQNSGGELLANAQLSARDLDAGRLLPIVADTIEGQVDLQLQFNGSGRSTEALLTSATGSGVLSTDALAISGMRADGFAEMIRQADAIGYEITPADMEELARAAFLEGGIRLEPDDYPFSIASGDIRIANATAKIGSMTITADASVELLTGAVRGDGRLSHDAGDEAVAGPQPEVSLTFRSKEEGGFEVIRDFAAVTGYLTQRALEREQARVEALQARLLEKQRLRREVQYYRYLRKARAVVNEESRLRGLASEREAARVEELEEMMRAAGAAARRLEEQLSDGPQPAPRPSPQPPSDQGARATPRLELDRLRDVIGTPLATGGTGFGVSQ
jgi:hypothetical protein